MAHAPSIKKPALRRVSASDLILPAEEMKALMQAVLARGATFHFRARGLSMSPLIKDGDVITLAPPGATRQSLGRVAAFAHPASGALTVHRIVALGQGGCLLQGDNTGGASDGWVPAGEVLGWVVRVERGGRRVRFGLGCERRFIAWLSRHGHLVRWLERWRGLRTKFT